jgi:NgoFVII restriction endonuclease.
MSSIIRKKHLFDEILIKPAKVYDKIYIVSGFATPSMVDLHLRTLNDTFKRDDTEVNLIVGMTPYCKVSKTHHENFVKLSTAQKPLFKCSYVNINKTPIHSKLYIWMKNETPRLAYISSANYTYTAFKKGQDEIASLCDPEKALAYYKAIIPDSLYCTHEDAEDLVVNNVTMDSSGRNNTYESPDGEPLAIHDGNHVKLPLYGVKRNVIQKVAGLNWGQRFGREPNQAYIPIPTNIAKSDFFPPLGVPFSVLTDDNIPFVCVRAQPKTKGGRIGYAIETTSNNSELGEYFRRKLGLQPGVFVELEDLDRYGNRYVTFTKINEEEYYMQFLPSSN